MAKLTTHYSAYIDAVLKRLSVESQPMSFRGLAGSAAAFLVKHGCAVIVERRPPSGNALYPDHGRRSQSACGKGADMIGMLELAITLAAGAHRGQTDKGGQPYILHPLRVMAAMDTDQERIVAVLHDAVEDSPDMRLSEIAATFGTRITAAIDALTKRDGEPYDAYLDRVKADKIAIKVKLADLKDNSDLSRLGRDPTEADRKRLDKYLRARAILLQAMGERQ